MVFGLFHSCKTGRFPYFPTLDQRCGYSYQMGLKHSGRIRENITDTPKERHIQQLPTPYQERKSDKDTTGFSSSHLKRTVYLPRLPKQRLRGRPLATAAFELSLTQRLRTKTLSISKYILKQSLGSQSCG